VPSQATVFIGWNGPRGFEFTQARILNLSLGGAAVAATRFPPEVHSAWIRGAGTNPDHPEWVFIDVQEISYGPDLEQLIRLRFTESCPYEIFKTVVLSARNPEETPSSPRPSDRPPSCELAASPSRAADRLRDCSAEILPAEPASVIESLAVPASPLRAAFASRWRVRGDSVTRARF
jgi:hypothetical protein